MSFLPLAVTGAQPLFTPLNGDPLLAGPIQGALVELAAFARAVHADLAGPHWVSGMDLQTGTARTNPTQPAASIAVGACTPLDTQQAAGGAFALDLAVRSRQPVQREVVLPYGARRLIVANADSVDDRLAIVWPVGADTQVPDGAVALAYVVTDEASITQHTDVRTGAWQEHLASGGSSVTVTDPLDYLQVPGTALGMLLRPGDRILLRFEALVENKVAADTSVPYPDVQFMLYVTTGVLGVQAVAPVGGSPTEYLVASTQSKRNLVWDGLYDPRITQTTFLVLDMRVRAVNAAVSDAVLAGYRLLAERPVLP